jgi:hypothetical protein
MVGVGVDTTFFKGGCRLVQGDMVLARGVWLGTLYKLDVTTQVMGSSNAV